MRRVVGLRVSDPGTVDDLVQETLARLLAVEDRLDHAALAPYAIVTARNLVRSLARRRQSELRRGHRLLDLSQPDDPEERALREEDRRTLTAALARLPEQERLSLIAHDAEGVETKRLAEHLGSSPGAVAVRLSRARARLRVEYLLSLRGVELPTPACKSVLFAISSGQKREQRALGAGDHLLACEPCALLSQSVAKRGQPPAALWPFVGLADVVRWLRRTVRSHPAPAATATAAVGGLAVWAIILLTGDTDPTLFVQDRSPIALSGAEPMAPYADRTVEARAARVQAVPGPGGFWLGESPAERVWVDLHEAEPSRPIAAGQRVSFRGRLVPNTAETLDRAGAGGPNDRAQLERQGYHVDVEAFS